MNTKTLLFAALAAGFLASCDTGTIYGPNTATITATITPPKSIMYDSVVIDVRSGSFRGPLYETNRDSKANPFQSIVYIDGLAKGDWVLAAVYYKTNSDGSTNHRVAVAQGSVTVQYDQECDCRYLEGDDVNLELAD